MRFLTRDRLKDGCTSLTMLILIIILSNLFFEPAYAQSPWTSKTWYVIALNSFSGQNCEIVTRVEKAFPSVEAMAYHYAEHYNADNCLKPGESWYHTATVSNVVEGSEFTIFQKCNSITHPCPSDGMPFTPRISNRLIWYQYFPDPDYSPPTCPTGPQGIVCHDLSKSCPPGFNPITCTRKVDPKNLGKQSSCLANPTAGNPIDIGTGNKIQVENDFQGSGPSPLMLERTYNSLAVGQAGLYGSNWRSTYDRSVKMYSQAGKVTAAVFRQDGKILYFQYINSEFKPTLDVADKLVLHKDSFGKNIGTKFLSSDDGGIEAYDIAGRLISITSKSGVKQILEYSNYDGRLAAVSDSFGKKITFSHNRFLTRMADPMGNEFTYEYDWLDRLVKVTYPDQATRKYIYDDSRFPNALTGIVDENGVRFATWTYDNEGRAISSEHFDGVGRVDLTFGDSSVDVFSNHSLSKKYRSVSILGKINNVGQDQPGGAGCGAASSKIIYDVNGNVASVLDFNGNVTTFKYDLSRNLEIQRVEAAATSIARVTTTEWHSALRLPVRIAAPKLMTSYTYDSAGNMLSKAEHNTLDPNGSLGFSAQAAGSARKWEYGYNSFGQITKITGPRKDAPDVTVNTYDPVTGDLLEIRNALNQVTALSQYDANGRVGVITSANGVNMAFTYTPRGWLKSESVISNGITETTSYTYDLAGLLKSTAYPDGTRANYMYDNSHRLVAIEDGVGNVTRYTLDERGNRIEEQLIDPTGLLVRKIIREFDTLNRLQRQTGEQ